MSKLLIAGVAQVLMAVAATVVVFLTVGKEAGLSVTAVLVTLAVSEALLGKLLLRG